MQSTAVIFLSDIKYTTSGKQESSQIGLCIPSNLLVPCLWCKTRVICTPMLYTWNQFLLEENGFLRHG